LLDAGTELKELDAYVENLYEMDKAEEQVNENRTRREEQYRQELAKTETGTHKTGTGKVSATKEEVEKSAEDFAKENIEAINNAMKNRPVEIPFVLDKSIIDPEKVKQAVREEGIGLVNIELKAEEKITKELEKQADLQKKQKKKLEEQKKEHEEIQTVLSGFENVFNMIGRKMGDSGKNFLSFMQTAFSVAKQIFAMMSKSESGESVGVGDIFGMLGSLLPLFFLAEGGPAKKGGPYVVGERGPELFIPDSSGMVLPNTMLGMAINALRARTDWSSSFRASGGAVMGGGGGSLVVIPEVKIKGQDIFLSFNRFSKSNSGKRQ
jgi:hypothetical protein